MNKQLSIILPYIVITFLAGSGGHLIYNYLVVPYICQDNAIQKIADQCIVFDYSGRALMTIPFIIIGLALMFVNKKYNNSLKYNGRINH